MCPTVTAPPSSFVRTPQMMHGANWGNCDPWACRAFWRFDVATRLPVDRDGFVLSTLS